MPPYLTPLQIFENYKNANPQKCKGKSTTEICQLAGLSDEQIKELKKTNFLLFNFQDEKTNTNQDFNSTAILGGDFSSKTPSKNDKTKSTQRTTIQYHPVYKDLILDKQGEIDMSQFEISNLKQRYNPKHFNITVVPNDDGCNDVIISDKKTNEIVLKLEHPTSDVINYKSFKNSQPINEYTIEGNKVTAGKHYEQDSSYSFFQSYDGTRYEYTQVDKNKVTKGVMRNNQLVNTEEYTLENGVKTSVKHTWYSNNIPYKTIQDGVSKDLLVDEIYNNLHAKDIYGYEFVSNDIIKNIIERINKYNIDDVNDTFWDKYDQPIQTALQVNKRGLNLNDRLKLAMYLDRLACSENTVMYTSLSYFEELSAKYPEKINLQDFLPDVKKENRAEYSAYCLRVAIAQNNMKAVRNIIKNTDAKIIVNALKEFPSKRIFGIPLENIVSNYELQDLVKKYPKITNLICADYKDIVSAIYKSNTSDNDKNATINLIIDKLEQSKKSHIAKDMKNHATNKKQLIVDSKRIISDGSGYISTSCDSFDSFYSEEFDIKSISQAAPNCWLVAQMIALIYNTKGQTLLKHLYKIDTQKQEITVKLKSSPKEYKYSFKEVGRRKGLVYGDLKVRAIAMAVDDFLKEKAYNSFLPTLEYDTTGNTGGRFYEIAFGKDYATKIPKSLSKEDINNKNVIYTLSYKNNGLEFHVIAITSADDKNVYYHDPHGEEGSMSWKEFKSQLGICNCIRI